MNRASPSYFISSVGVDENAMRLGNERNVTDYILGSGMLVAKQRLMARRHFQLQPREYLQFLAALGRTVQEKPRLRRLLTEPSVLAQQEKKRERPGC